MEKSSPKVCFVMQSLSPGTHMDYVFEMVKTLQAEGSFSVRLLVEKPQSSEVVFEPWVFGQKFTFAPLRVSENFLLILRERLKGTKVFYVHYSFVSAIAAGLVVKMLGGKVLYWNAGMPWQYKRSWWTEKYQHFAFKCIDVLVTGAPALVPGYASYYKISPSNIEVIPNWIDLNAVKQTGDKNLLKEQLSLPLNIPLLLFVHKVAKRKGSHWLVPIMQAVADKHCHLIVAGDGPELKTVQEEAAAQGLSNRIHLLGRVDRETVTKLYQVADIFVMPSEEEGSPHSLIEAMAHGLPFATFAVGGVTDTISPLVHEYSYPYGDIEALACGINTLLRDKNEYNRVSKINSDWVRQFDKPIIVKNFLELLIRTIKRI